MTITHGYRMGACAVLLSIFVSTSSLARNFSGEVGLDGSSIARTLSDAEIDLLVEDGERAYRSGQWVTALDAFRAVVAIDSSRQDAWLRLGNLHHQRRDFSMALDAYRQASSQEEGVGRPSEDVRRKALINLASVNIELARTALSDAGAGTPEFVAVRNEIERELSFASALAGCATPSRESGARPSNSRGSRTASQPVRLSSEPPTSRGSLSVQPSTDGPRKPIVEYLNGGPKR